MQPELLTRGATADVGDAGSMEGMEAAGVGEGWACEGVEGEETGGATFCLRVGERGSVRRAITWRSTDCRRMASSRSRCRAEIDMNADWVLAS
jgi:hypothetical protein